MAEKKKESVQLLEYTSQGKRGGKKERSPSSLLRRVVGGKKGKRNIAQERGGKER